jgi:hypothetical protein
MVDRTSSKIDRDFRYAIQEKAADGSDRYTEVVIAIDAGLTQAAGLIDGRTTGNKTGRNANIDIGTEDVISQGGLYTPPTVARVHNIVSSSASDTSAGVGARTITINGLDSNYSDISEIVTLNGTTLVATVNSYIFINRMTCTTVGTSETNVGNITATAVTDATISAQIIASGGQSQLGVYQVPLGKTMYLSNFNASARVSGGGAGTAVLHLMTRTFGGVWIKRQTIMINLTGNSFVERMYKNPLVLTEKTMVKIQVTSDTNNMDVTCAFDYINITAN